MVFNVAVGVHAARTRAGVLAALANAGQVGLAVGLDGALGPAALGGRGVADHARNAGADGLVVLDLAVCVSSARRRRARV